MPLGSPVRAPYVKPNSRRGPLGFSLNTFKNSPDLKARWDEHAMSFPNPEDRKHPLTLMGRNYLAWEKWRNTAEASPVNAQTMPLPDKAGLRNPPEARKLDFGEGGIDLTYEGGGDQDMDVDQIDAPFKSPAHRAADRLGLASEKIEAALHSIRGSNSKMNKMNRDLNDFRNNMTTPGKSGGKKPPQPPLSSTPANPGSGGSRPVGPHPSDYKHDGPEGRRHNNRYGPLNLGPPYDSDPDSDSDSSPGSDASSNSSGPPRTPPPSDPRSSVPPSSVTTVPCDVQPARDPQANPNFSTTEQGMAAAPSQFQDSTNPKFTGSLGARAGMVSNEANDGESSYQGIIQDKDGDRIEDIKTVETAVDTLRAQYGMESAGKVIPSTQDQLASDIRFDLFDTVNPGYGEGSDNKLFLMQEARDEKIIYSKPMFEPGSYIGPIAGVVVPPWQLQRVMPADKMKDYGESRQGELKMIQNTVMSYGKKSTNLLGDDVGYPFSHSACELKRNSRSPFEPVIRTDMNWQHVKDPCGYELNRKKFRLETDAQRYPRHLDSRTNGMGGPVLKKRRGLEVILQ